MAIIGGGYVGLWTAIRAKERDPGCRVTIVEKDYCGAGASGRSAGDCVSWAYRAPGLVALVGEDDARDLIKASEAAQADVLALANASSIDVQIEPKGWIWAASGVSQVGAWEEAMDICERLGMGSFAQLASGEARERTGSPRVIDGVLDLTTFTLQPARLAIALREKALEQGVEIFENTRITKVGRRRGLRLHALAGTLDAERVVIATNAWAAGMRGLRRTLVAVSSEAIVTERIPEQLDVAGILKGREALLDGSVEGRYCRRTPDDRLLFGLSGQRVAFGPRINGFDRGETGVARLARELSTFFPQLGDVKIAWDWSGAVDMSRTGFPILGPVGREPDLIVGVGWSGNGIGPSAFGGRVLASLALGSDDQWAASPLVGLGTSFPPEPLRYFGTTAVKRALLRAERSRDASKTPSRLTSFIASHKPKTH